MKRFIWICLLSLPVKTLANGVSPYLPINLAPEVELQIEKLMAMTGDTPLSRPYKATEVLVRLEAIKDYHPILYNRLSAYLKRYTQEIANTHRAVTLSTSDDNTRSLENNRGVKHTSSFEISAAGHVFYNPYIFLSVGANYSDEGGRAATNTHLSMGNEYLQMDIGFRDHWLSPMQDSAMLLSTHAENPPSVTFSNTTGITDFNLRYEVFYAKYDEETDVLSQGKITQGKPEMTGMHISLSPFERFSVGFTRTYYYGGGLRDNDLSLGFKGLFTPSSLEDTRQDNNEQGYGQTAVSAKWNMGLEIPLSVYAEFAQYQRDSLSAEDDSGHAISAGFYAPVLFETMSLRYEITSREAGWYESSFYPQGLRNKNVLMGHWSADEFTAGLSPEALTHHIMMDWELWDAQQLAVKLTHQSIEDTAGLSDTFQLNARYSIATEYGFFGIDGTFGKDATGDNYNRLSAFYRW
ncbi:capsule assembly Wzi family protein [Planctobacterium marinum]|uniref:Capsule assembly protein Wzi n=1 Tax=Planctobacterium marinum TaxID=1631968 RepID=A0AA48KSN2_9ALTE|nr:hypothetical protein MACH26_00560 [Planctobacterium marinum]